MFREIFHTLACLSLLISSTYSLHIARDTHHRGLTSLDVGELGGSRINPIISESIIGRNKATAAQLNLLTNSDIGLASSSVDGDIEGPRSLASLSVLHSNNIPNHLNRPYLLEDDTERSERPTNDDIIYRGPETPIALQELFQGSRHEEVVNRPPLDIRIQQKQHKKRLQQQQHQQQQQQQQQQQMHQNKRSSTAGMGGSVGNGNNPPNIPPHSIASQLMLRSARGQRQYDVPQIECPPAMDGMERFACPTPDRQGRYRCIDDHVLCDGFIDCPEGEDEDRQACMFYKTGSNCYGARLSSNLLTSKQYRKSQPTMKTKAHLDVLADALLRWARGR